MTKNITLSAEEDLIRRARDLARRDKTTLNALFREWLSGYVGRDRTVGGYAELMDRLEYVVAGASFSRDEMNER